MSRRPPLRQALAMVALAGAALLATAPAAHAGRACDETPQTAEAVVRGLALATRTARALDDSGASVVLLARAGQDLGAHGLRWSHLGFAYRDSSTRPAGTWRVVHKLNHCGSGEAALWRQGLGEFFLDRPHRHEASFVVLAPALQARLLPLLHDNAALARAHERRYSLVAYPWATTYQQSNQWAIETLALAAEGSEAAQPRPAADAAGARLQAQAWLMAQGYQPTVLRLGPLTRLGARARAANVAFDDHPNAQRFADRIETVTVDSVWAWLPQSGLGETPVTVR